MPKTDTISIDELLTRGVEEVIDSEHLKKELESGRKFRIKFGIDPTKPDLHLGHAVVLRKLRQFQDLGHKAVLIIGDFTATVGDPTGRTEARKPLTKEEVKSNAKDYISHAMKILSKKNLEVRWNSEWHGKEGLGALMTLAQASTIQQSLQRADFKERISSGGDVTMLELLYPLFQGYDSVKVEADVELGGTDQKFNLLMGRRVQRFYKMAEQDIMTVPLLEGTDGVKKMSKSFGNYIALDESPDSMFGKIMSINDNLIEKYFLLCTGVSAEEIGKLMGQIKQKSVNPRDIKARLAKEIVSIYHNKKEAEKAEINWRNIFTAKEMPDEIPELKLGKPEIGIVDLLVETKLASSKGEARRLIEQGGVKVDGEKVADMSKILNIPSKGILLQVGKRHFVRVI